MAGNEPASTNRMTASERRESTRLLLDLSLRELTRRLTEEPESVPASTFAEVTKIVGLYQRHFAAEADREDAGMGLDALIADLPSFGPREHGGAQGSLNTAADLDADFTTTDNVSPQIVE